MTETRARPSEELLARLHEGKRALHAAQRALPPPEKDPPTSRTPERSRTRFCGLEVLRCSRGRNRGILSLRLTSRVSTDKSVCATPDLLCGTDTLVCAVVSPRVVATRRSHDHGLRGTSTVISPQLGARLGTRRHVCQQVLAARVVADLRKDVGKILLPDKTKETPPVDAARFSMFPPLPSLRPGASIVFDVDLPGVDGHR